MTNQQLDEEAIFHIARQLPNSQKRADYLDQVCHGDQALRQRVLDLLQIHDEENSFLKSKGREMTATTAPPSSNEIKQVGPYKIREKIGEGGMGVVYVAQQQQPVKRKVALKLIKPGMDSDEVVARFEAERQALAMMDHPGIAKVFDGGVTESGQPYFAMELINGIPITQYCDEQKLALRDRLQLFIAVCHAVQHAHQKGVIHRDIKPTNVLVTLHNGKPVPVIIDFGVAKATNQSLTDQTIYTRLHQVVGTTLYMSPEQAELSRFGVDTRTDIYSLGVLLYEMLAGVTPFDRERFHKAAIDEVRRIIREEDPPKPSTRLSTLGDTVSRISSMRRTDPQQLRFSLRGDLDWIVMMSMEKDRNRRYETANGLALDVERYLKDEPIFARPPSTWYRMQKFYSRNRAVTLTSLLVVLSISVGLCLAVWGMARAKNETQRANVKTRQLEIEQENLKAARDEQARLADQFRRENYASDMMSAYMMWKLNDISSLQATLDRWNPLRSNDAIEGLADLRRWEWKFLETVVNSSLDIKVLKTFHSHPMRMSTSADVSRIAITFADFPAIVVFDQSGKVIWQDKRYLFGRWQVPAELSPCGRYLAYPGESWKGLVIRDLDEGTERHLLEDFIGPFRVEYNSEGDLLFIGNKKGQFVVVPVRENPEDAIELIPIQISESAITALAASPDGQHVYAGCENGSIKMIPIAEDESHAVFDLTDEKQHNTAVNEIAITTDGRFLATAGADGRCAVISLANRQRIKRFRVSKQALRVAQFDAAGNRLVLGSRGGNLRVYRTADFKMVDHIDSYSGTCCAQFTPDGNLMMGANENCVATWDFKNFKFFLELQVVERVRGIAVSSSGDRVWVLSNNNEIEVWDLTGRTPVKCKSIEFPNTAVHAMLKTNIDGQERIIVVTHQDKNVSAWWYDWQGSAIEKIELTGLFDKDFYLSKQPFLGVGIAFDGKNKLALGEVSGAVALADLETGHCKVFEVSKKKARITKLSFVDSGTGLSLQASLDGRIYLHIPSETVLTDSGIDASFKLADHDLLVISKDLNENVASTIRQNANSKFELLKLTEEAYDFVLTDNQQTLVSTGNDCTIRLWDVKTGRQRMLIDQRPQVFTHLDVSANGKVIAAGSRLGKVLIFRHNLD